MCLIGLNPNALTPKARRNLLSVAAGNTSGLASIFNSFKALVNVSHQGFKAASVDVVLCVNNGVSAL